MMNQRQTPFRTHRLFFSSFFILWLLCGLLLCGIEQGDLIWFFSEHRAAWSDLFFTYATQIGEEPTYVIATLGLLLLNWRKAIFVPLIGLFVTVISYNTKAFFAHPRPARYFKELGTFDQLNIIEGIDLHTGLTSFPSGHTMSAFALFTFLALSVTQKSSWSIFCLGLAVLVGLSRIYLSQHFLQDVFGGAIAGLLIGYLFHLLSLWFINRSQAKTSIA